MSATELRRRDGAEPKLAERSPQPNDARRTPDGSAGHLPSASVVPGRARSEQRASATAGRGQGKPGTMNRSGERVGPGRPYLRISRFVWQSVASAGALILEEDELTDW